MKQIPKRIELGCQADDVTLDLEAGVGTARRFRMHAYTGKPVSRAFGKMVIDLSGVAKGRKKRPILLGHDDSKIVGWTDVWEIDRERGIFAEGQVSSRTDAGKEVIALADEGFPWQASVGVELEQADFVGDGESRTINGQAFDGPGVVVTRSRIYEASFVPAGADENTKSVVLADGQNEEFLEIGDAIMAEDKDLLAQFTAKHQDRIEAWKAEARAEGEKSERDRFASLLGAFPDEAAFVVDQFAAGADASKAAIVFNGVLAKRIAERDAALKKAEESLKATGDGSRGVDFGPVAPPKKDDANPDESKMTFADRTKSRWDRNYIGCRDQFGADGFAAFERFERNEERHNK